MQSAGLEGKSMSGISKHAATRVLSAKVGQQICVGEAAPKERAFGPITSPPPLASTVLALFSQ